MTLDKLTAGQSAKIISVNGTGELRHHLLDMGLTPGTPVTLRKVAPMGDPVELSLRGYELTIRLADAACIDIEAIERREHEGVGEARYSQSPHPGVGELMTAEDYHNHKLGPAIPKGEPVTFALAGNQNSGKTTLFNQLTGSNQHVGNFPGVTVDRKDGTIRGHSEAVITDLPGIYSLSPYSSEEIVTRDFLIKNHPDGIINIVDASNIERNLYLTLQLMELGIPMVLALNMMDEVRANGGSVRVNDLERVLGIPVVPISAVKNEGIEELIEHALHVARYREAPGRPNLGPVEDDGLDKDAALANQRYRFIEKVCAEAVFKPSETREHRRSVAIDKILTGKYTAIPCFIGIMAIVFVMTFSLIGAFLSDLMAMGVNALIDLADAGLRSLSINEVARSLVIDGALSGIGSVLSFLPTIVTLFFFLSILEDTGYMARVAFVMDKLLRRIGLSGRSFVPMLIGFGCSVPAIMATRTLSSERDRKMTILLTPFMSCSAKLPIYSLMVSAFFPKGCRALAMVGLYFLGIVCGILYARILKRTVYKGEPVPFVLELPNYRLPGAKNVLRLLWDKAKGFVQKAFTIIFLATVIIWFLQTFDWRFNVAKTADLSLLAAIGRVIAPIFQPLGFGDWRISTALITGFTAKESVVSTLTILLGGDTAALSALFTPFTAFVFLVFTLLYTPCIAAVATVKREIGGFGKATLIVFLQCVIAWVVAFAVHAIGVLVGLA